MLLLFSSLLTSTIYSYTLLVLSSPFCCIYTVSWRSDRTLTAVLLAPTGTDRVKCVWSGDACGRLHRKRTQSAYRAKFCVDEEWVQRDWIGLDPSHFPQRDSARPRSLSRLDRNSSIATVVCRVVWTERCVSADSLPSVEGSTMSSKPRLPSRYKLSIWLPPYGAVLTGGLHDDLSLIPASDECNCVLLIATDESFRHQWWSAVSYSEVLFGICTSFA